ncbi:MAG: hypothetical protein ABEL76_15060 [Bradymonadaceae bacterium]
MRPFDAIGIAAVGLWIAVTGLYVYRHEVEGSRKAEELDSELVLEEGENWLILQREREDVGFVHRTRTRLSEGWLIEYDMALTVEVLGQTYPIRSSVKATVDRRAYLQDVQARLTVAGRTFRAQGEVRSERTLRLLIKVGDRAHRQTIELTDPIRLASTSVNQLLGEKRLEPGRTYEETFFDPTAFGRQTIELKYVGREKVDVAGDTHRAHHIVQKVRGRKLDVYLDDEGSVLIQEFPLKMVGLRVPEDLGRSRAASIREKIRKAENELKSGSSNPLAQLEFGPILDLFGFGPRLEGNLVPTPDADSAPDAGADSGAGSADTNEGADAADARTD